MNSVVPNVVLSSSSKPTRPAVGRPWAAKSRRNSSTRSAGTSSVPPLSTSSYGVLAVFSRVMTAFADSGSSPRYSTV